MQHYCQCYISLYLLISDLHCRIYYANVYDIDVGTHPRNISDKSTFYGIQKCSAPDNPIFFFKRCAQTDRSI